MEVISQEWRQSHCAYLPLELWERIIAAITDSRYHARAWLYLRLVSRTFKAATEHVWATRHLPATRIEFRPLALQAASRFSKAEVVELSLDFESLSEDGERAVFASKRRFEDLKDSEVTYRSGVTETIYDVLARQFDIYSRASLPCPSVEDLVPPNYAIIMANRDVNDTELPGLEFDLEGFKVSFLWKPMLSMFYGESEYEKWADKVSSQHHAQREFMPEALQLGKAVQAKQHSRVRELLAFVSDKMQKDEEQQTRLVRTKRFKRMLEKMDYQEKGEDLDDYFSTFGKARFVESIKQSLFWDADDDGDEDEDGPERFEGCFYDGMGLEFDGMRELNKPGECSDNGDEWEDDGSFSDASV